ncbi:MAG: DNA cytosine methyltransferase [Paludibacteraceae bacterium]|nr:DNA cytosine methyltransferase [Paludibacteraceae bacterium]
MSKNKYTFIDLFAGCGGLSLGLEQAGFESVFFNEIIPTYASTYIANHNLEEGHYFIGDINELNTKLDDYKDIIFNKEHPVTMVCGGPPCQGFSMANRQHSRVPTIDCF